MHWSTIRTVILAAKSILILAQCDNTEAFVHAKIPEGKDVDEHQPHGSNRGSQFILCLNQSFYGMRQRPRYFFKYLTQHLKRQGPKPSDLDPCLFMSDKLIAIIYVDDVLVYTRDNKDIDDLIKKLQGDIIRLCQEGTIEGYIGIKVERDGSKTTLSQPGLVKQVVEALGLCDKYPMAVATPTECAVLPRDIDGQSASGSINYPSAIWMVLYLGHTQPEIDFAVHQCAPYTFELKQSHKAALKRNGCYLNGTLNMGLLLDPDNNHNIDCYPDADFAGLFGHEHPQDPRCVRS